MNDYRENYFNPAHPEQEKILDTGYDRYNSDEDRITEQEMVPDIAERLTTRYDISYNLDNTYRRKFNIPGLNNIRIIKLIKQLIGLLPRNVENGKVNDINTITVPIQSGDTELNFNIQGISSHPVIVRAYLASSMIDMTPDKDNNGSGGLSYRDMENNTTNFLFTPTIPFKQNDELIVYYK